MTNKLWERWFVQAFEKHKVGSKHYAALQSMYRSAQERNYLSPMQEKYLENLAKKGKKMGLS